jgi:hypothetical protein
LSSHAVVKRNMLCLSAEAVMTEQKFRVGQLVRFRGNGRTDATHLYQVVHAIPATPESELQYRLRGIYEWHERVAVESQISRAVKVSLGTASGAGMT